MATGGTEDRRITDALERVWMAALDARVILREEGGTEDDYARKQQHHMQRAEREIPRRAGDVDRA